METPYTCIIFCLRSNRDDGIGMLRKKPHLTATDTQLLSIAQALFVKFKVPKMRTINRIHVTSHPNI